MPADLAQGDLRDAETKRHRAELCEQGGISNEENHDAEAKENEHRRNTFVRQQHEGYRHGGDREDELGLSELDSFEQEPEAEAQHEPMDDGTARDLRDPADGTTEAHDQPKDPGEQPRGPHGGRRDGAGAADRRRPDGLHWLDRDRSPVRQAGDDLEHSERHEHARRIDLGDSDVADD